MLIEYKQPDFKLSNNRGILFQLVHNEWKQVNYIFSNKGSVRGGHYHKYNQELFFVIQGIFRLVVWDIKDPSSKEEYRMTAEDMFLIKENVHHTFEYIEDTYLISMYNHGVEQSMCGKDIWTE